MSPFLHAQHMMGQRRQQAGAVLARRAVDQHRAAALGQGLEVLREQGAVPRLERRLVVIVEIEVAHAGRREVGLAQEGQVRRLGLVAQIAEDHPGRKALMPARGLAVPLPRSPQVHQGGEAERGEALQVARRRRPMMSRTEQSPGGDAPPMAAGVVAIVAEILDGFVSVDPAGHARNGPPQL
jgi:hypothetical protein